ncbi:MAG: hypothetical protein ACQES4_02545 [Bacillota bacterium]
MAGNNKNRRRVFWVLKITIYTFFLAIVFGFVTQFFLTKIQSLLISFIILLSVVAIGVLFDVIGTAAAAAKIGPINAKAARKTIGAKKGVYLVKHAEQVANFCNDVAGDISGVVSGTLAAILVYRIMVTLPFDQSGFYIGIILTAVVAALTVGGKAWGKIVAINYSTEVMLMVGALLTRLEQPVNWFRNMR